MEEKEIIKSEKSPIIFWVFGIFGGFGLLLLCAGGVASTVSYDESAGVTLTILGLVIAILATVFYFFVSSCELTVTDKRVHGKAAFGQRVDLPFDSISAVSLSAFLDGVAVATSSGKISFLGIKNANDIHEAISSLLLERQNTPKTPTTIKQAISQSNADELKKYKELLDMGAITQEEFDAKKKQLLGL